jgi:serine/threonine-protein kinase
MRVMTPEYASPEQVRGEAVGTATDVYSLGVILYQLLTGAHPYEFDDLTAITIERVVCETMPPRPSTKVREAPGATGEVGAAAANGRIDTARWRRRLRGDLDVICLKALQKDPERRYSSVEALQEDIRRNLAGQPVLAQPDSFSYRAGKFATRHRVGLGVAAAVLAGFVALGSYHTVRLARERDRAQSEAAKAEQVAAFLQGLFEVSDPSASRGETITARELLDAGSERIERELAGQPEIRAAMMRLIGNVYHSLGLFSRARPLLEQALEDHRRLFGDRHEEVAATQATLATLLQDLNELDAAEAMLRDSLETRRALLGERHPQVVEVLSALAFLLEARGDMESAEQMAREALEIGRASLPSDDPFVLDAAAELAGMLRRQGRLDEAEPLLREVLAARRAAYGNEDLDVASTVRNLASLLRDRGTPEALEEAEGLFREAIATRRMILGGAHPEVAVALNSYAMLLDRKDDLDGAITQYRELIRILEQSSGGRVNADLAAIHSNLAAALRRKGLLDEAGAAYARSLQLGDETLEEGHPNRAFPRVGLAEVYMDQDRPEAAEALLREALAIRRAGLPEGHRYIGDTLIVLGNCLAMQGQFAEAETLLIEGRDLFLEELGEQDGRTEYAERRLAALYEVWERSSR